MLIGLVMGLLALTGASPIGRRPIGVTVTPALGNYPDKSIVLSANTTVTPDAAPTNATSINVSTSTDFKGKLEGNPCHRRGADDRCTWGRDLRDHSESLR